MRENSIAVTNILLLSPLQVDQTNPSINKTWIGPREKLSTSWWSRDNTSGIRSAEYCIGTTPEGCQVKQFTSLDLRMGSFECSDCTLQHKVPYYFLVRVWNAAGLYNSATSRGLIPDHTAPSPGTVEPSKTSLSCRPDCSLIYQVRGFIDKESGLQDCTLEVRKKFTLFTAFKKFEFGKSVEFTGIHLSHAAEYVAVVQCTNNVGLISEEITSEPTLVDNTAPIKVRSNRPFSNFVLFIKSLPTLTRIIGLSELSEGWMKRLNQSSLFQHPSLSNIIQHHLLLI